MYDIWIRIYIINILYFVSNLFCQEHECPSSSSNDVSVDGNLSLFKTNRLVYQRKLDPRRIIIWGFSASIPGLWSVRFHIEAAILRSATWSTFQHECQWSRGTPPGFSAIVALPKDTTRAKLWILSMERPMHMLWSQTAYVDPVWHYIAMDGVSSRWRRFHRETPIFSRLAHQDEVLPPPNWLIAVCVRQFLLRAVRNELFGSDVALVRAANAREWASPMFTDLSRIGAHCLTKHLALQPCCLNPTLWPVWYF